MGPVYFGGLVMEIISFMHVCCLTVDYNFQFHGIQYSDVGNGNNFCYT